MPDAMAFTFHFLRPWWLIALIPAAAMMFLIVRYDRVDLQWGRVIAPHLLDHLIVKPERSWGIRPVYLVGTALCIAIVAMAGPAWRRERPPFVEDKAPLMIVLDVSVSMNGTDIPPSRLERAKQKVRDLLTTRSGARTGLIAYAGTAHLVMPLTADQNAILPFLTALSLQLMPVPGKNPVAATTLGAKELSRDSVTGTILLVSDDLASVDNAAMTRSANHIPLIYLAMTSDRANATSDAVMVSVDDADIRALERRIETSFEDAIDTKFGTRWRDEGFWLVIPCVLLSLLWFRPGTTVQWMLMAAFLAYASPSRAEPLHRLRQLWLTPDQQGQSAFNHGDCFAAKTLFQDSMWRGIAAYCAFDFLAAAEAFAKVNTPEGRFALGNAQAQNRQYEKAIASYDAVLAARPNDFRATTNKEIVRKALEAQEARRREQEKEQPSPPELSADEVKVDPDQTGGKRMTVQADDLTSPGATEAWMRQVQTSPESFLKLKFSFQAARSSVPGGSGR